MELKPCPFCGSNNLHLTHNGMQNWVIGCGVCQVEMENFVDREQAIKAWNTRATDECNCNSSRTSISNPELCGACGKLIPPPEEG